MNTVQSHNCSEELKQADLKVTPARLGVLAALETADMPLDVITIISFLEAQNIKADKATVFRIINTLTEKGLAIPIQLGEGKFRYEHSAKADHHHFICENCGSISDISDCNIDDLQEEIQQKKGLLVKRHSVEFFGLCQECQR